MTLDQLKVRAYDLMRGIASAQAELERINQEIARLQPGKKEENDGGD